MSLVDIFKLVFRGKRPSLMKEPGPISEAPALQDNDIHFILREHILRKFGDREFYGPGAGEVGQQRARSLGIAPLGKAEVPRPKKEKPARKRKSRNLLAGLIQKRDKLKREIEDHEK